MLRPEGDWYHSVGQGMGKTLVYATEKQAYTLTDRGTYYAFAAGAEPRTDLVILVEGDERLHNPYGVIAVSPERFPHVNHEAAMRYIEWLTSPETQAMIGRYRKGGKQLFHPALGGAGARVPPGSPRPTPAPVPAVP
jgi:tungstate transport system substrate-binding protein